ncbi:hypothetical protein [Mycobacterium asiaticum]|uniref:hypothetical protein n=1 Tax=Mycobacterium asiaticum TaxID=1790 RepID=UPI000A6BC6C2|nr:hypothetical protein [Mycobacterium asiaticum]
MVGSKVTGSPDGERMVGREVRIAIDDQFGIAQPFGPDRQAPSKDLFVGAY